jgi:translation elongation factor EF-Tu-like GTPase
MANEEGKLIGAITHYFGKIKVAIIKLSDSLKTGDQIRIAGGTTNFAQVVDSMEVDRQKIEEAKSGDEIGLKVIEDVREGYAVYKL